MFELSNQMYAFQIRFHFFQYFGMEIIYPKFLWNWISEIDILFEQSKFDSLAAQKKKKNDRFLIVNSWFSKHKRYHRVDSISINTSK